MFDPKSGSIPLCTTPGMGFYPPNGWEMSGANDQPRSLTWKARDRQKGIWWTVR